MRVLVAIIGDWRMLIVLDHSKIPLITHYMPPCAKTWLLRRRKVSFCRPEGGLLEDELHPFGMQGSCGGIIL